MHKDNYCGVVTIRFIANTFFQGFDGIYKFISFQTSKQLQRSFATFAHRLPAVPYAHRDICTSAHWLLAVPLAHQNISTSAHRLPAVPFAHRYICTSAHWLLAVPSAHQHISTSAHRLPAVPFAHLHICTSAHQFPVDPNPPSILSLSPSSSTFCQIMVSCLAITICAILSPELIMNGCLP